MSFKNKILPEFLEFNLMNYKIFEPILIGVQFCDTENSKFDKCSICFCSKKKPSRPNTCFHSFCNKCLSKWNLVNNSCPVCRSKFLDIINLKTK